MHVRRPSLCKFSGSVLRNPNRQYVSQWKKYYTIHQPFVRHWLQDANFAESTRKRDLIVRHISNIIQYCSTIRMHSSPLIKFVGNRPMPFQVETSKSSSRRCTTMLPYSLHPAVRFPYKPLPILASCQLVPKFSPVASAVPHRPVAFSIQCCTPRGLPSVDLFDNRLVLI